MISVPQALIYTMVVISASDRDMKNIELARIGEIVRSLPAFAGFDPRKVPEVAQESAVIVQTANGLDRILAMIAEALSDPLRETAYLLACEIAAADARYPVEEFRLLQKLRHALGLDRLVTAAFERATLARYAQA